LSDNVNELKERQVMTMKTYYFKLYRAKRNKKLHKRIDFAGRVPIIIA